MYDFFAPLTIYDVATVKDGPNVTITEMARTINGVIRPYRSNGQQADQAVMDSFGVQHLSGVVYLYSEQAPNTVDKATGAKGSRFYWDGFKYEVYARQHQKGASPDFDDMQHWKSICFLIDERSNNYEPPPEPEEPPPDEEPPPEEPEP